ncbi:MAG: hypothetical protein OXK78_09480 [Caldilineaceae bacterium]|nr:hypothetical protein [Caldilineaceae bacterium]
MKNPTGLEKLEDVLDAYVAFDSGPNEPLDEWIRRYPEYEQEIIEFAANWSLMKSMPPTPDAEEVDQDTLVLRGMSVVQNLLHTKFSEDDSEPVVPFASLIEEGQACGLDPNQFARAAGLGILLLRKLDRRLIRYASIPQGVIEGLAAAIHSKAAVVAAYLQQGPTFATAAEHRSEQAPALTDQEDFFDAVHADRTIDPEHAARWLDLE